MKNKVLLKSALASTVTLLLVAPLTARADVKIETLTHLNEVTGLANHDSDTTDYIQGDKKREENLRKFTGAVAGAWQKFRGEDKGSMDIDIYLVSDNKHYDLDPKKKTYNEDKIYDPSQQKQAPQGGEAQQQQEKQDKDVKVTKNEFTVKDTGKTQNINGFDTREYLITWDYETQNTKTGETSKSLMTTDTWTSTDGKLAKAREAEVAYQKAYLKLMQMPVPGPQEIGTYGLANGHVVVNGQDMKSDLEKLRAIKGLPVSTDITWELGGTDKDGKSTSGDKQQSSDQPKNLDAALGSLFGSKSDDSSKQPEKKSDDGMVTFFSSHIEVKSVDTSAVDASQFQVPSDYKVDD